MDPDFAFHRACRSGDLAAVRAMTQDINVETLNARISPGSNMTRLYVACLAGQAHIVKFLLSLPGIDVNGLGESEITPLEMVVDTEEIEDSDVLDLLLKCENLDVHRISDGLSTFERAFRRGQVKTVKMMLASNKNMMVEIPNCLSRVSHENSLTLLLKKYQQNPDSCRQQLRRELGWPTSAAEIFALVIFVCDDFVRIL